jgi:cytochrome c
MKTAWILALCVSLSAPRVLAQPQTGSDLFEDRCVGCHVPAGGGQGPSLTGVYGRRAGAVAGFD